MTYTYILLSQKTNKSYVGSTENLFRRLYEHNSGKCAYTKRFMPWKIFYHEEFPSITEARKREKYFKSCAGRKFMRKLFSK